MEKTGDENKSRDADARTLLDFATAITYCNTPYEDVKECRQYKDCVVVCNRYQEWENFFFMLTSKHER